MYILHILFNGDSSIKVLAKSINININSEQRIVIKTEYHNYGKPDKT